MPLAHYVRLGHCFGYSRTVGPGGLLARTVVADVITGVFDLKLV